MDFHALSSRDSAFVKRGLELQRGLGQEFLNHLHALVAGAASIRERFFLVVVSPWESVYAEEKGNANENLEGEYANLHAASSHLLVFERQRDS